MKRNETAQGRYDFLRSWRDQYLWIARKAAHLTLPWLIKMDDEADISTRGQLREPWQSAGAKGVNVLASKLMLALMPVQTSFFKLQLDEMKLDKVDGFNPQMKSEVDQSFSKIERTINQMIAASDDRVVVHQALKHLVVAGNVLIFMGKDKLKLYPLNRYVCDRDGLGNVIEIVTRERINRYVLEEQLGITLPKEIAPKKLGLAPNAVGNDGQGSYPNDMVELYTIAKRQGKYFIWHQEVNGKKLPKTEGKAPLDINPWIALRFNTVDGEPYGRGRVEEYMGDLRSLEALTQAIVEGSAAAAKVIFVVSPSSTTKAQTLSAAGNGAIVQGRPDDIGVVQVGKTADFSTAQTMIEGLEKRIAEAFLELNVRQSERTTAEEVRMTQQELEQQLGGLFSLLTVDFLVPYLARKLSTLTKAGEIPKIPKELVKPTVVAGLGAIGRGQDRDALTNYMTTIAQTMGPESIQTYVKPLEVIKRLAAAEGIDTLNLVKTEEEMQGEQQQAQQAAQQEQITGQAAQLAKVGVDAAAQGGGPPPQ